MCRRPIPTLLRQSAQRADRLRSGPLGQAPHTMGLVKEACRTHGGECNAADDAKTLPMAGTQFKQNHREFVKPTMHCDGTAVEYSDSYLEHIRSSMTRFSQPSFLNGPPQPLVLMMDGQGRTPFELYRLIASPAQPSFLLDSGKGTNRGGDYSFLGSDPYRC